MKPALPPPGSAAAALAAAVLSLLGMASSAAAPAWWSDPATSIAGDTPVNDWAAANLGQLKHVATQAKAHLDFTLASIGGAGPEIDAMCQFTQQDNYAPAAVGQLKNVAKVFYDRLAQAQWNWQTGYPGTATTPYPWTGTVHAENAAPINIGQLKNVFSFDLSSWASFDQDADSMADGWEVYYGLNPGNSADGDLDWDHDGLTNQEEYNANANPLTADTDGDFSPDAEEAAEGTDPRLDTSAPVTLCAVYDSVHWPIDYLPPANPQPWETSHPIWYEYFQRWDGQAPAVRPGGRGGPLYDPPGSLSGQASLIDTAATLTAWNVRWDHTTVLRSEAGFRSDGEGSARTSAARLWLRGPKSSSPVTRTFVKLVRREVPPVPPLSGITEEYSTVTFTIPANQNHSAPQSFTAVLSPAHPARSYTEQTEVSLLPIEFEVKHTGIDPAAGQAVNLGANTMLRDEIVDIRFKVPPIGTTDWTVNLSVEPEAMRSQNLPNRGSVQMYDFGQVETNGTVTPDKTQFVLEASEGGERTIKAVFNKEGTLKIRMKSTDGKLDFTSPEYTIQKRMRKYAGLPSSQNHDLNQHDKAFVDAASHWGGVYQHQVDDVERLKAMGMAESELGLTDATDILTVGNPGDHVLDTFRNVPPYDRFPGVAPAGGLALREVDIANNSTRMLSYPAADETPAATAIHWGVCWLYQKASSIRNNPNPPQPPNPPNPYIPGPWRSWDTATERYNGGGVPNYLQRINRPMKEGRHPSNADLYIWPLKSNKKARGNQ